MQKYSKGIIHLGVVVATLLVTVGIIVISYFQIYKAPEISSYEECMVAKGSVIQESYPETCVTKGGQSFVHILSEEEKQKLNPPTPTPNSFSDWDAYKNEEYGFEFKYPNDFTFLENQIISVDGIRASKDHVFTILNSNKTFTIEIHLLEADNYCSHLTLADPNAIAVAGIESNIFINTPCGTSGSTIIISTNNTRYFKIIINHQGSFVEIEEEIYQILSTFKFVDSSVESTKEITNCFATGCSGQICSNEDISTTCEFKEEYACYDSAICELQDNGKCGWTPTEDLQGCLINYQVGT